MTILKGDITYDSFYVSYSFNGFLAHSGAHRSGTQKAARQPQRELFDKRRCVPFSATNIICMVLMGVATAVGAMVGYDKVIQTIKQIVSKGGS